MPQDLADADELDNHWWWRPGWGVGTRYYTWHITFSEHPEVVRLVADYQRALSHLPDLDPIPAEWLHMTIQGVGHVRDLPDNDARRVVDAVAECLADVPVPLVTFGRARIHREAIVLPPDPTEPLHLIRDRIRDGIFDALGAEAIQESNGTSNSFRPHVSIAYSSGINSVVPVRAALDAADVSPVSIPLSEVVLIIQNRDNRMYEWVDVARIQFDR